MPVFEYVCVACGSRFEKLQKSDTADRAECPACGSVEVEKQLSKFSAAGTSSSTACHTGGG